MKQQVNGIDRSAKKMTEEAKEMSRRAYKKAQAKASELKESGEEMLTPVLENAKVYAEKMSESGQKAKKYAKENPYKTAFAAASIAAILAWLFTSNRKNR